PAICPTHRRLLRAAQRRAEPLYVHGLPERRLQGRGDGVSPESAIAADYARTRDGPCLLPPATPRRDARGPGPEVRPADGRDVSSLGEQIEAMNDDSRFGERRGLGTPMGRAAR